MLTYFDSLPFDVVHVLNSLISVSSTQCSGALVLYFAQVSYLCTFFKEIRVLFFFTPNSPSRTIWDRFSTFHAKPDLCRLDYVWNCCVFFFFFSFLLLCQKDRCYEVRALKHHRATMCQATDNKKSWWLQMVNFNVFPVTFFMYFQ